ncbi:hypothetical protein Aple_072040 [Acrocarpospora pleiomorpha]|uniref:Carrier domain-containing protein n=1 Tax=Acrocarpospora pleiomorpha TaxID=90975 RepID=A0A5M3XSW2_9ACTN|nr:non-ribosomal peptide synthetase [Acrocarpospora pleiomorpha]GES24305.1 hypothetical protein Aple_072040 [Acrocarpospora pleiomorpha]
MTELAAPTETLVAPVSLGQRRLWFVDGLAGGGRDYSVVWPLRLSGVLDVDRLNWALSALVTRHEVLRSRFVGVDGEPVMVVDPPAPVRVEWIDAAVGPDSPADVVAGLVRAEGRRVFDLAVGPVVFFRLVRVGALEHVLVVSAHHIVFDGWSGTVFLRDLAALYRGEALADLVVSFSDFAVWERENGVPLESLAFWREALSGVDPVLDLPLDRARPVRRSGAGERVPFGLDAQVTRRLGEVCRGEGATLFMGLLAAMNVVVSRYCGSGDVVVGTFSSNRVVPELEELVGFFVNTLVLRTDLSGDPGLGEVIRRSRDTAVNAFAHQEVPFDRVVEELAPARTPGVTPFVQVAVVVQNTPEPTEEFAPGLRVEPVPVEVSTAAFDLSLHAWQSESGELEGFLEYSTELWDRGSAERLGDALRLVLEAGLADLDLSVYELPLVPPLAQEVEQSSPARLLHELIVEQAARCPGAVAATCAGAELTYGELEHRARRLAARLNELGVSPGTTVGVCLERSLDVPVALLAVLLAGAAYLPLEPEYPRERLTYMIEDSGTTVIITDDASAARLPEGLRLVRVADGVAPGSLSVAGYGPDSLAYVIYTSGSTGRPKGVGVPHGAVTRRVSEPGWLPLDGHEVFLFATPLSFDVSVLEVFGCLVNGHTLAILPPGKALPERVAAFLATEPVTVTWLTAALFHAVVDCAERPFPTVRWLIAGGDQLSADHVGRAAALVPNGQVMNGYGPTECTIFSTCYPVPRDHTGHVPIGDALPYTSVSIVDRRLHRVPDGVTGELLVGGDGLARGYLGRPGLTAERFVPDPRPGAEGRRLYRTGDLVRRRGDGLVEFLGRADQQVKIRGFRVELAEIEAVLRNHRSVRDTVVTAPEHEGDRRVIAYVVAEGAWPGPSEMFRHARLALPEYMVPSQFILLDALPVSPSGKVDRAALPEPEAGRPDLDRAYEPPRDPIEQAVAGIWTTLLGLDRAGVHDHFFDLGGHSLLASRLLARIRRAFGRDVPLADFLATPTIANLSELLRDRLTSPSTSTRPAITPGPHEGPLPPSLGQRRLWFVDGLAGGGRDYSVVWPLRLSGVLDVDRLNWALSALVARHEVLRSRFVGVDGEPVMVVDPPVPVRVEWIDASPGSPEDVPAGLVRGQWVDSPVDAGWVDAAVEPGSREGVVGGSVWAESLDASVGTGLSDAERDGPSVGSGSPVGAERTCASTESGSLGEAGWVGALGSGSPEDVVAGLVRAEGRRVFDLAVGPVVFFRLVRVGALEHVLVVSAHHIVFDGWSGTVFLRDLAALYRGEALADLAVSFSDFAVWERENGVPLESLAFWREALSGADPVLDLPLDRARPARRSGAGERVPFGLDAQVTRRLGEACRSEGATLFMGLLAAMNVVVSRYCGSGDVVVGTFSSNRVVPELEELVGFFVNTLVLRTDLSGDPGLGEVIRRSRDAAVGAFAHQEVPFDRIVEELAPARTPGVTPFVQVAVVVQNTPEPTEEFAPGLRVEPVPVEVSTAAFDLSLHAWQGESGELEGFLEYSTELWDRGSIERLGTALKLVVEVGVADLDLPVHEMSLISREQPYALDGGPAASDERIACLFARRVEQHPQAVAFRTATAELTYAELDRRARALAVRLHRLPPESVVGVRLSLGLDLPVAALAILYAGAVYLPLDPSNPDDRLNYMIDDSDAQVIITDGTWTPSTRRHIIQIDDLDHLHDLPDLHNLPDLDEQGEQGELNGPRELDKQDELDGLGELHELEKQDELDCPPELHDLHELDGLSDLGDATMVVTGADPEALSAIVYTSGSTGRPKGVAITGRSLLNRLAWMHRDLPFAPGEVACQKTPIAFVDSLWELLGPALAGVPTVVLTPEVSRDPHALVAELAANRVSRILLVPSLLRVLVRTVPDLAARLPYLTSWISSGEPLSHELDRLFREVMPGRALVNLYGASEAWDALCPDGTTGEPGTASSVPVGRPIAGVRACVLDRRGNPMPMGVPGELYVGGACLARGYLGRPALTAERFLPDPAGSGQRLYRTGDLARVRTDGQVELLGRADHQVKIRGVRVEPGEVETVLEELPEVAQAAVVAVPEAARHEVAGHKDAGHESSGHVNAGDGNVGHEDIGHRLVAYVVPAGSCTPDGLRRALAARLPAHLIPAQVVLRDELPRTATGKIDRRSLAEDPLPAQEPVQAVPATPLERRIAAVWAEVLGRDVGGHDDFFDVGGHSLLAPVLVGRLSAELAVELPLSWAFDHPTVHAMSRSPEVAAHRTPQDRTLEEKP